VSYPSINKVKETGGFNVHPIDNGPAEGLYPKEIKELAETVTMRLEEPAAMKTNPQTSALRRLAGRVAHEADLLERTVKEFHRPMWLRSGLLFLALAAFIGTLCYAAWLTFHLLQLDRRSTNWSDFLQGADSGLQIVSVILGGFVLFLWRSRAAARRKPVILQLQRLVALVQVIDREQLDIDPYLLLLGNGHITASRPRPGIPSTPLAMANSLDHYTDLVALIGHCAAYLSQKVYDREVRVEAWNTLMLAHSLRNLVGRDVQSSLQLELVRRQARADGEPPSVTETPEAPGQVKS
jgi:hypothetical protein